MQHGNDRKSSPYHPSTVFRIITFHRAVVLHLKVGANSLTSTNTHQQGLQANTQFKTVPSTSKILNKQIHVNHFNLLKLYMILQKVDIQNYELLRRYFL